MHLLSFSIASPGTASVQKLYINFEITKVLVIVDLP